MTKNRLNIFEKKLKFNAKEDSLFENKLTIDIFSPHDDNHNQNYVETQIEVKNKETKTKLPEQFGKGHRLRVKERFVKSESDKAFLDEDLIEMVLFYIKPMIDVKPLSKQILHKFKNLNNFINATHSDLQEFFSDTTSIIFFLKLIKVLNERRYKNKIDTKESIVLNWQFLIDYLHKKIGILDHEEFRVVYLNSSYRLIEDVSLGTGTVDEISVYIRDIIKKAVQYNAKFFVIAHNHPSGIAEPSKADIKLTMNVKAALNGVDITLLDHIIITSDEKCYFSFQQNSLL